MQGAEQVNWHRFTGNGDGTFAADNLYTFLNAHISAMVPIRDGTGHAGIAYDTGGIGGHYIQSTRVGKIDYKNYSISSTASQLYARDFDGDGVDELIFELSAGATSPAPPASPHPSWAVSAIIAAASNTMLSDLPATDGALFQVGDFNGDGKVDLHHRRHEDYVRQRRRVVPVCGHADDAHRTGRAR